jgi:deazaflavin-dependent oxidoreductase (nitroreductase family)
MSPPDFNQQIIDEFHANQGRVGGMFEGRPMLLLHTVGAKSGKSRVNPLAYLAQDGRYFIFASKAGAPTNPDWYHNLKANPDVQIEVGANTIDVTATEVTGPDRDRLFSAQVQASPQFGEYQKNTDRIIPVVALTPSGS